LSISRHSAFVYDSDEELVEQSGQFLEAGIEAREGVLVAASRNRMEVIRRALDAPPAAVRSLDAVGTRDRPARLLGACYAAAVDQLERFDSLRLLIELQTGPAVGEWPDWIHCETALGRVFERLPVTTLCAYDSRLTPAPLLAAAGRAEPEVTEPRHQPLPELRTMSAVANPEQLRERLGEAMCAAGVGGRRAVAALTAVNEIGVNAWSHGAAPVELRCGRHEGRFVGEVIDHGTGFDDPLAGFDPPAERGAHAPGLWVVRQLVWRLESVQTADGFAVRVWI
jgi:anti-sigma regulatory factor (Ser/Thr protein kinase)